jgi:oligopeptide/dipeptide ABC transporter ATP-binding protein
VSLPPLDAPSPRGAALLSVEGLRKRYPTRATEARPAGGVSAVDGVSFSIAPARTLALVGESGSGKTTVGRLVARLEAPDAGRILFDGEDWLALSGRELRRKRRNLQIVFQDPQTSLNPRMRVGDQVAEPLRVQKLAPRGEIARRVAELLKEVGLDPAGAERFPSEFSGGQRQRIAIARALATRPRLLVCDEPVSALDASIAAQIVNLLLDLQRDLGLSYLFISHDLPLVTRVADQVAVLYLGRIVEEGSPADLVSRPLHPYTTILISAVPEAGSGVGRPRIALAGETPSAAAPPAGCAFAPRCPIARPRCREESPGLTEVEPGRFAACFYPGELRLPAP